MLNLVQFEAVSSVAGANSRTFGPLGIPASLPVARSPAGICSSFDDDDVVDNDDDDAEEGEGGGRKKQA